MLKVVIVDDESNCREVLVDFLREFFDDVMVLGKAASVEEAVVQINELQPDLIFLDIELQTGTGFDILERVNNLNFEVIFTTAFEHYAIKAIKFSSIDYLLKPIDVDELRYAVDKARDKKNTAAYHAQLEHLIHTTKLRNSDRKRICLATAEATEFVEIADIFYCQGNGSYTDFHLRPNNCLIVSKNLKEYEMLLAEHDFMRVHNRFLINLLQVKKYVKSDGGYIIMNNDQHVSISNSKKDEFLKRMASLT